MKISLVIPVLNEEEAVPIFYKSITEYAAENEVIKEYELELLFVNDGSRDNTLRILNDLAEQDKRIAVISFSRCFGKESALMAGLRYASGDACIPIDVDLQDPLEVIPEMIRHWKKGYSVVLGKRCNRDQDSFLKRFSSVNFYRLFNKLSPTKLEPNVGDFRLMDRQVVNALLTLPEQQLFMKGLFAWLGFSQYIVEFERPKRVISSSRFNSWKLWNFALEGITSFSTIPLRIWLYLGTTVAFCSFLYAVWMILDKIINGNPVQGYPSLMTVILFLGGIQAIGLGVMGEYIGRIYMESKRRPRYIIEKTINIKNSSTEEDKA